MLAYVVRRSFVVLPAALLLSACAHVPTRDGFASRSSATQAATQSAAGQVASTLTHPATLTLTTRAGTTTVDALSDSATAVAIGKLITPLIPELTVESSARGSMLRLGQSGHSRVFLIDDVPVSDGFRVGIRTSLLESIEVVQDSLVTAQYGPRATEGVVVITTSRKR